MPSMNLFPPGPPGPQVTAAPGMLVAGLLALTVGAALAPVHGADVRCPWIVQPYERERTRAAAPTYAIRFDHPDLDMRAFYGFSVTTADLAWKLAGVERLPDLSRDARPLESARTVEGISVFRVAAESLEPNVIYLIAAQQPIAQLERLGARIEPERQLAVSQLASRTRGGSDQSGPLPEMSVPGFLIAEAGTESLTDVPVCAYQLAGG